MLGAAVIVLAGVAGGCTESVPPVTIASLRIVPQSDSFFVGQTTAANPFAVTLLDANGNEISDGRQITYTSSNTTLFTVDASTGAVTGKGVGSGLYRATVGGRFTEANVKIIRPVAQIQLNTPDFSLTIGQTRQLIPTLVADDGSAISGRLVTYSTSNLSVATVSTTGLVTALSEGTAIITAFSEQKTSTVTVTVMRDPVAVVRLTPSFSQLMRVGGQLQVTATAFNANNQALTGRTVTWSSSAPQVASVNGQGQVTALTPGTATISADIETKTANLPITVTLVPIGSVTLVANDTLAEGDVRQYNPVVKDSTGKTLTSLVGRTLSFQSNNLPIASVANTGVVNALSQGNATITATVDNVISNDLALRVARITSVTLSPNPATIGVGGNQTLTVTLKDASGNVLTTSRPIAFQSSAPGIAAVNQAGVVAGVSVGTATISASINGIVGTATITVQ